jgi:5-methylcytosine-specific restriction protein A
VAPVRETRTSRGSSRKGSAAMTRPSGRRVGRSLQAVDGEVDLPALEGFLDGGGEPAGALTLGEGGGLVAVAGGGDGDELLGVPGATAASRRRCPGGILSPCCARRPFKSADVRSANEHLPPARRAPRSVAEPMMRCLDCGILTRTSRCLACAARQRARCRPPRPAAVQAARNAARGGSGYRWQKIRAQILARDGGRCLWCGSSAGPLEVDHIVPLQAGGDSAPDNLRTLCRACHAQRRSGRGPA